jgi:hypothetical protein
MLLHIINTCNSTSQHTAGGSHLLVAFCFHDGSTVVEWNPMPYMKSWIATGRRHSQCVGCTERSAISDATAAVKELWKVF